MENNIIETNVDQVMNRSTSALTSRFLHNKKIVLGRAKHDENVHVVSLEGSYGQTEEAAGSSNNRYDEFLTCTGYNHKRTLRHPFSREYVIYGPTNDFARTESQTIADFIAYSVAHKEGKSIAEKLNLPFVVRSE